MANHLLFEIICSLFTVALTAGPDSSEKQTEQTCRALDTLVKNGYRERIGKCTINRGCTSVACRAELVQPAPNTAVSIISFDPCSNPVSVHVHVNTSLLKDPILNERVTSSKSVKATPEPLGTFSITLKHHHGGVTFGVAQQSLFDPQPVKLFPETIIPFKCNEASEKRNSPMDYSNGHHEENYTNYYDNQQEERNPNYYQRNETVANLETDNQPEERNPNYYQRNETIANLETDQRNETEANLETDNQPEERNSNYYQRNETEANLETDNQQEERNPNYYQRNETEANLETDNQQEERNSNYYQRNETVDDQQEERNSDYYQGNYEMETNKEIDNQQEELNPNYYQGDEWGTNLETDYQPEEINPSYYPEYDLETNLEDDYQSEGRKSNFYPEYEREINQDVNQEFMDHIQDEERRSGIANSPTDQPPIADQEHEVTTEFNSTADSENSTALPSETNIPVASIIQVLMIKVLLDVVV